MMKSSKYIANLHLICICFKYFNARIILTCIGLQLQNQYPLNGQFNTCQKRLMYLIVYHSPSPSDVHWLIHNDVLQTLKLEPQW